MVKLRISNCQSLEEVTLQIKGLTVLTGPSNSGKTALERAVRGLFTNPPHGSLLRHGTEQLTVTLAFDDGQSVSWEKGPKVNRYTVNGKLLERVERKVPEEVWALGVAPITLSNKDVVWAQFATQFPGGSFSGPIFLLDRPGSVLAEVVSDVEKVGKLSSALRSVESDRRSLTGTMKLRKEDRKRVTQELTDYTSFSQVEGSLASLEEGFVLLSKVESEQLQIEALYSELRCKQQEVHALTGVLTIAVPDSRHSEGEAVLTELRLLTALGVRRESSCRDIRLLTPITNVLVPSADKFSAQQDLFSNLEALKGLSLRRLKLSRWVEDNKKLLEVSVPPTDKLTRLSKIKALHEELVLKHLRRSELQNLLLQGIEFRRQVVLPERKDCSGLNSELRELLTLQTSHTKSLSEALKLSQELAGKQEELRVLSEENQKLFEDLGTCPLCQSPLNSAHPEVVLECP